MRYTFHGHESELDLKDVITFEPDLADTLCRLTGEPDAEEALATFLDFHGAKYVREQSAHLEVVGKKWAQLAPLVGNNEDRERIRAIPERLCFRFDPVWSEGRAAVHLMLRAVSERTGCELQDAPLYIDQRSI